MESKELRIGNLVWDDYSGVMIVSSICSNGNDDEDYVFLKKNTKYPSGMYCCEDIEPIPLTEEWLFNLGFKQNGEWYELDNFYIDSTNFNCGIENPKNIYNRLKCVGYVHQLQNLYWVLCNKELKINL